MKRRHRIYLETSFFDRLGDQVNLEMRRTSYRFLNRACQGHQVLVSPIVCHEIEETPDPGERTIIQRQLQRARAEIVGENAKARRIARELLDSGGFGDRMLADLLHAAYAILGRANALVTWDRRTLARQGVRAVVQAYCAREGRAAPLIGVPGDVARWLELET